MGNRCPSVHSLVETFRWDEETAEKIRWIMKAPLSEVKEKYYVEMYAHHVRGELVNKVGEFAGFEYAGKDRQGRSVYYLNSGDTCSPTLFFFRYPEYTVISTLEEEVGTGRVS